MNWMTKELLYLVEILGLGFLALESVPAIIAFERRAQGENLKNIITLFHKGTVGGASDVRVSAGEAKATRLLLIVEGVYVLPGQLLGTAMYEIWRVIRGKT